MKKIERALLADKDRKKKKKKRYGERNCLWYIHVCFLGWIGSNAWNKLGGIHFWSYSVEDLSSGRAAGKWGAQRKLW